MAKSDKKKPAQTKPGKTKLKTTGKKKRRPAAPVVMALPPRSEFSPSAAVLDHLWAVVMSRRDADPTLSHSARLLSRGTAQVAQKFGEEAVECLIEAATGNRAGLIGESADVLYHLIVMWVNAGLRPDEVWAELKRREGISGIAEKAARAKKPPRAPGARTKKIP